MRNALVTNFNLQLLAKSNNCESIYGMFVIFIPGRSNFVSNQYVLYIFDLNTYKIVTFSTFHHKPNLKDVLDLLSKLTIDTSKSMLVTLFAKPFNVKQVVDQIEGQFKCYHMFKNRPILGVMGICNEYISWNLSSMSSDMKNGYIEHYNPDSKTPIFSIEEFVDLPISKWNDNTLTCIEKVLLMHPEYKDLFIDKLANVNPQDLCRFKIENRESGRVLTKIMLSPENQCDVNNKLLKSVFYFVNTDVDLLTLDMPQNLLIHVFSDGNWFTLNKSVLMSRSINLDMFMSLFQESIFKLKNRAYPLENIDYIVLRLFNMSKSSSNKKVGKGIREYSTYRTKSITPLSKKFKAKLKLGVLDIETIFTNGKHTPYAIGYQLNGKSPKIYYISDFGKYLLPAYKKIMATFTKDLLVDANGYTLYVHNLGGFDGYLLLKEFNKVSSINILMDQQKKFISIDLTNNYTSIKDSLRILPASLDDLSKLFNVKIKKGHLDHNSVDIKKIFDDKFKIEVIEYLKKDLISLLDIMNSATNHILSEYNVDLSTCYSASSMAMKIYRTNFLKEEIPTLPSHIDQLIRESYRGGATEVYKCYGKNLYHYDVNSLYPYAMLNPIPYQFLRVVDNPDLTNFYGFIYAKIYASDEVFNPFLPLKDFKSGNILYPKGSFSGTYFSEELKLAASKGYKITTIKGYEFSQKELFVDYVNYFYNKKNTTSGGERFLYKLMLNSIYGYLGRTNEPYKTEILTTSEAKKKMLLYRIHEYVELDEKHVLLVRDITPDKELQKLNNIKQNWNVEGQFILNNVAIASAITSYARIAMIPVKTDKNNPPLYTDTDSVFVQYPLNPSLVGDKLGQFKDELKGSTITEALFLAPKMYGYKTIGGEKVVIAGVKPGSVSYSDLERIWNGEVVTREKFIISKSLSTMSITNKISTITLSILDKEQTKKPVYDEFNRLFEYSPIKINTPP